MNPHLLTLTQGHDPTFPDVVRETEENREEVFNSFGINPHNLWSNNSDNIKEWKGEDVLSKSNASRRNYLYTLGINLEKVADCATGRDGFSFKSQLFVATATEHACLVAFFFEKVGKHVKTSSLIARKLLLEMSISIEEVEAIDERVPSQQDLKMHSSLSSKIFSQAQPTLFHKANEPVFIDNAPLTPTTKDVILSCIIGIFYILLHTETFPILTNPDFSLSLFHPRHAPNS